MQWHIGCSGFSYPDWKNKFYTSGLAQKEWLTYYSQHFNTVEINSTFYHFPKPQFLRSLYEKSNESFVFSVKAPRLITHYKKFNDSKQLIADFYSIIRSELKQKLGAVLFQLPASIEYTKETLDLLTENLDQSFKNVVEFRHRSWWDATVYETLGNNGICFCSVSHPKLPDQLVANTSFIYYRLHGSVHLFKSRYKIITLKRIKGEIRKAKGVKTAYVYFNNTMNAVGPRNAMQMIELME